MSRANVAQLFQTSFLHAEVRVKDNLDAVKQYESRMFELAVDDAVLSPILTACLFSMSH